MIRRLLLILLLASPCWATISAPQAWHSCSTSASASCNITITANGTGATELLIATGAAANGTFLSSLTTGGTWTCPTNTRITASTPGESSECYLNAPGSAVTTITCTFSASASGSICQVIELKTTGTSFTLDTQGTICDNTSCSASCTACASAALTLTGSNDVIVSGASCGGTCSGAITGWTTNYASGDGAAYAINTNSGTAFNWNQTSSQLATSSLAFSEVSGSGPNVGFKGTVGLIGKVGIL